MRGKILVTGATGNVGAEVVRLLREGDHQVRAADRTPNAAGRRFSDGVEQVWLDFGAPESYGPALAGVERMFLIRPRRSRM